MPISSVIDETSIKKIFPRWALIESKTQWYKLSLSHRDGQTQYSSPFVWDEESLNLRVNNFNRQSWWTFFIVLLKWICRLYLLLHHDFVKSFSKVTVLPRPAVDSRKITLSSLTEQAKNGAFWSQDVSLEATCWRWFHQMKLFSSHTCGLKLVLSDSELDKSLSKYSSNFLPKYGRFSHLGRCNCKQLNAASRFSPRNLNRPA